MTSELAWLRFAIVGVVSIDLMLRYAERRRPVTSPPHLMGDVPRVALLGTVPFAVRLLQSGGVNARADAYPPMTLPMAAWSIWVVSLLLLALPLLMSRRRRKRGGGPLAALGVAIAAVLVMGAADSPFDQARFEEALQRHVAYCKTLRDEVPEAAAYTDIRAELDAEIGDEIDAARSQGRAVFESRGTSPAVELLEERRAKLEKGMTEWRRRVAEREKEIEDRRRREREARESSYYSSSY